MQGLLDAGRIEDALHVLEGILKVVDNDVNSNKRGFDILSLLFAIDDITKQDEVPEIIIQLSSVILPLCFFLWDYTKVLFYSHKKKNYTFV